MVQGLSISQYLFLTIKRFCDSYKYLGVVLNCVQIIRGNIFKEIIDYTCDKARKACFVTQKKCKTIGRPPVRVALQLLDSCVFPVYRIGEEEGPCLRRADYDPGAGPGGLLC